MTMTTSEPTWSLDREIVLSRVLDAPRERVFRAWTEAERIGAWFAPRDFRCQIRHADIRVGGSLRFDFVGANGLVYDNRITFVEIASPAKLVFDHGADKDDDPDKFRVTITFDAQSNGKTVLTLRQLHPTKQRRDGVVGFGAVEIGNGTLDKLAEHLASEAFAR
jgi:uncharacterized protein YndB with AHSA1/START domain